jgi:hypothetical protein
MGIQRFPDIVSGYFYDRITLVSFAERRKIKMKITGSMDYVKIDLENGYVLKAEGEMLLGRKFVVYKDTMKNWEPPHENEELCEEHI